jgi:anti-sigma regulatory factor (Ser/Thr protein kinase)
VSLASTLRMARYRTLRDCHFGLAGVFADYKMAEDMRPGGFGMLITNHSVDEVIYNENGNEVTLIKRLD